MSTKTERAVASMIVIALLVAAFVFSFSVPKPVCPDPIGWAYSDSCVEADLTPPIQVGENTTQCFWYKPTTDYSTLSYIVGDFNCGPFAPYASLTYTLYDANCDSLIYSGAIHPTAVNSFIWLDTAMVYRICYTWTALCEQFSACPIINPSFLPLTWLSVQGKLIDGGARISWATASEINCSHFVVEKMEYGKWFDIGNLPAKGGNSTYTNTYVFTDFNPGKDNYYRIRQVDNNGVYSHSKVIFIRGESSGDCYYMTMIGEVINDDISRLPSGIYIRRCEDRFTLITITQ